jgi:hypothetical protein
MNAIIKANSAMASESAKPKIVYENNCRSIIGFFESDIMNEPKTNPIPIPAPVTPIVAHPEPIDFIAIIKSSELWAIIYI